MRCDALNAGFKCEAVCLYCTCEVCNKSKFTWSYCQSWFAIFVHVHDGGDIYLEKASSSCYLVHCGTLRMKYTPVCAGMATTGNDDPPFDMGTENTIAGISVLLLFLLTCHHHRPSLAILISCHPHWLDTGMNHWYFLHGSNANYTRLATSTWNGHHFYTGVQFLDFHFS